MNWRIRGDIAGFLLAGGYMAMAAWLLISEGHWTGVLALFFGAWWSWHALTDRPVNLDIRNAPDLPVTPDALPEQPIGPCCFCGDPITDSDVDPSTIELWPRTGEYEVQFCHLACFRTRLVTQSSETSAGSTAS